MTIDEMIITLTEATWYGEGELEVSHVRTWRNDKQAYEGRHFTVRFSRHDGGDGYGAGPSLQAALEDAMRREQAHKRGDKNFLGWEPPGSSMRGAGEAGKEGPE